LRRWRKKKTTTAAREPMRATTIPAMAGAFKDDLDNLDDSVIVDGAVIAEVGLADDDDENELSGFVGFV